MMNCSCGHLSVILAFISLISAQLGNKHQNNLLVSAKTVHQSITYIILYTYIYAYKYLFRHLLTISSSYGDLYSVRFFTIIHFVIFNHKFLWLCISVIGLMRSFIPWWQIIKIIVFWRKKKETMLLDPSRWQTSRVLTHWGPDKMAAIFQTTFSKAFSRMKIYEFWLRFHWSLFPRVQLTIFQHWFR